MRIYLLMANPDRNSLDNAIAGGIDRRATGGGEIDATVHFGIAQCRMLTLSKAGGETGAVNRRTHQCLFDASALFIIIVGETVISRLETIDGEFLPAQCHGRPEDGAFFQYVAIFICEPLEIYLKAVARLDFPLEVDVIAEDSDQIDDCLGRDAGLGC